MGRLIAAGQMFWLEVRVYMVKVSYGQKPYRRSMMQTWAAEVFASPSMETNSGRATLAEDPDNPDSLGLAISEAVEDAASRPDTNYALGSVLKHVILLQTVIGLEAKKQFVKAAYDSYFKRQAGRLRLSGGGHQGRAGAPAQGGMIPAAVFPVATKMARLRGPCSYRHPPLSGALSFLHRVPRRFPQARTTWGRVRESAPRRASRPLPR